MPTTQFSHKQLAISLIVLVADFFLTLIHLFQESILQLF